MRWCALLLILFLLPGTQALSEESVRELVDASEIERFESFAAANGADFSIVDFMQFIRNGEMSSLEDAGRALLSLIRQPLTNALQPVRGMLLPGLLLALASAVLRDRQSAGGARFACRLSLSLSVLKLIEAALESAEACLEHTLSFSDAATPVFTTLLTAGGLSGASALIAPSAALAGNLIHRLFLQLGVPLCAATACLAIAGSLSAGLDLSKFCRLGKKLLIWGAGLAVSLFTGLIFLKGGAADISDSLAVRTAKYTVDSAASIIGSSASDAWETYLTGVMAAKSVVGVCGLAALLSVCLQPMVSIFTAMACLSLFATAMEAEGESRFA